MVKCVNLQSPDWERERKRVNWEMYVRVFINSVVPADCYDIGTRFMCT